MVAALKRIKRTTEGRSRLGAYLMEHRVNVLKTSLYELSLDNFISYTTLGKFEHTRVPEEFEISRLAQVYKLSEELIRDLIQERGITDARSN